MQKRSKKRAAWVALGLATALLLSTFLPAPLPRPAPLKGPLPGATPPASMQVFQLPTGVTHRSAAFAYRGGSFFDKREFSMTAVLVRHPRGDLLIDTGFGRDIDTHFEVMPWPFRLVTSYTRTQSAAEQLDEIGYDRAALKGVLLTHAHWDHVSGIPELAGTPVWVTPEERKFIRDGGALTALIRGFSGVEYHEYGFDGGEYLGFPKSQDIYGDGSVVVVPAPGHTPGSVIVFLTLPDQRRFALVGDLAWQREGIVEREERPWVQRELGDNAPALVRENLLRMSAIAERFPEITLVPAHEARGFVSLPRLH